MEAFLSELGLSHLSTTLGSMTLDAMAELFSESPTKLLNKLKEIGVDKLPERQKLKNGISKAIREGKVTDPGEAKRAAEAAAAAEKKEKAAAAAKAAMAAASVKSGVPDGLSLQPEPDEEFDLAVAMAGGVKKEDPNKKVEFAFEKYEDRITATALVDSLLEQNEKERIKLKTIGSATAMPPASTDAVIVGAGVGGLCVAHELVTKTEIRDLAILERTDIIGGVWTSQANSYSRVNSSEPAYRMPRKAFEHKETFTNHTPAYQILDGLRLTVEEFGLKDKLYLETVVESVTERKDGVKGWHVEGTKSAGAFQTLTKLVVMCTNRRLGVPRVITYPGEEDFRRHRPRPQRGRGAP